MVIEAKEDQEKTDRLHQRRCYTTRRRHASGSGEDKRSAAMDRVRSAQSLETFGCMTDGTASKLTDLSYTNFIMLLYRGALDRLRVRSNIILLGKSLAFSVVEYREFHQYYYSFLIR